MENVSGHHVAPNLDNKIKSCCSLDYIFIFWISTFILCVYDDPANNVFYGGKRGNYLCTQQCFLICQSIWPADMSYYMHVSSWYLILMATFAKRWVFQTSVFVHNMACQNYPSRFLFQIKNWPRRKFKHIKAENICSENVSSLFFRPLSAALSDCCFSEFYRICLV